MSVIYQVSPFFLSFFC